MKKAGMKVLVPMLSLHNYRSPVFPIHRKVMTYTRTRTALEVRIPYRAVRDAIRRPV